MYIIRSKLYRFIIELVLFGTTLFYEWVWLEAQGQSTTERFKMSHDVYIHTGHYASPATRLYMVVFLLIGTVCRCFLVSGHCKHI